MAIRLETSLCRGIDNSQENEISTFHLNWSKEIPKLFPKAEKRTEPSPIYNCHGLTFACRRTKIVKSNSLQFILTDDRYSEIGIKDALPGDIIIYYSEEGDPNHSGIIVSNEPPLYIPRICSKWGSAGEYIHNLTHCPKQYGPNYKFYRCRL